MPVQILVQPTTEPVSVTELKAHLRVDFDAEDAYLQLLISQAREFVEQDARISLCTQTLLALIEVPTTPYGKLAGRIGMRPLQIELPLSPVQAVSLVEGEIYPGTFQVIGNTAYAADTVSIPATITFLEAIYSFLSSQWLLWTGPYIPRFRVTYQAGYSQVPHVLRRAILELAAYWYDYREGRDDTRLADKTSIPAGIQAKIDRYRVYY